MRKVVAFFCGLIAASMFAAPSVATPSADPGKAVAYAMPVIAGGLAIYKNDWKGLAQLTVVTGLTYATAYGLKHAIRSCRPYAKPCGPNSNQWDSFPSTTSAIASAPSSFVWHRYGWEWGLPLFIISKYPSYALQKAKQNKLWDGLATTAIAFGYNEIFTTRYREQRGFYTSLDGGQDGMYVTAGYRW